MKFHYSTLILGLTAHGAYSSIIAERQACNANNCLRLIRGTDANQKPTLASRLADCSSFLRVTVTPAATTATVTTTVTVTLAGAAKRDDNAALLPRQVTTSPRAIPTYATSVCSSSAAYSSACSCAGVTKSTITVAATTSTVTATATQTVCPGTNTLCSGTCKNLQTDPANCGACGTICPSNKCANGVCTPSSLSTTCSNPAPCDVNAQCSGNNGCTGFCQPDADGVGHCSNDQAGVACTTQQNKTCNVNADCPGGFCINDCCDFKSCYYPSNNAFCVNTVSARMLFKKRSATEGGEKTNLPVKGDN